MPRIVSLIASATEIVHALGLGEYQVGRSHECDYPTEVQSLPVCTEPTFPVNGSSAEIDRQVKDKLASELSIYEVFAPVIEDLKPTHIITQTQCKVCAVSLEDVERALAQSVSSRPRVVSLEPNCLHDIFNDIRRVAAACEIAGAGDDLVDYLRGGIQAISAIAFSSSAPRPRVFCIEWHQPLMAAGNWVPELVELANAVNLSGTPGDHSAGMSWQDLESADPDIIISMPCGFDLARTQAEMYWLTNRPGWGNLRAVKNRQVYLVDGNQFMNRPGPRTVE